MIQFRIYSQLPLFPMEVIDIDGSLRPEFKYQMIIQADEISDEYHTMHELYQHRMALNIALFNDWAKRHEAIKLFFDISELAKLEGVYVPEVMKSKLHADGTMFDGYFIVMAITKEGQISYHYKLKHWDEFKIPEVERTPIWDGHTSLDVLERLAKL